MIKMIDKILEWLTGSDSHGKYRTLPPASSRYTILPPDVKPFTGLPPRPASSEEVERIVERLLRAQEARIISSIKQGMGTSNEDG
jgi:hypothetical protein